jgi:thiol-disulfide isomerase/thioredoxin
MMDSTAATGGYMRNIISNPNFIIVLCLSAIFLGAALYIYIYYISPKLNPDFVPNREFVKKDTSIKHATLYLFYVNWCPHSKKALPIWEVLKKRFDGKDVNGITVNLVDINGEQDEEAVADFEGSYKVKVEGYPTIFLIKGDQVIEYDATPTETTLIEFLNSAL